MVAPHTLLLKLWLQQVLMAVSAGVDGRAPMAVDVRLQMLGKQKRFNANAETEAIMTALGKRCCENPAENMKKSLHEVAEERGFAIIRGGKATTE